jgi:hypothetical protein
VDGLGRLGGAHDIQVDLATGWVTLRCGPDEAVDLASVPRAIRDAGFEPTALQLRAQGTFVDAPAPAFRVDGWEHALPLSSPLPSLTRCVSIEAEVTGWQTEEPLRLVVGAQ